MNSDRLTKELVHSVSPSLIDELLFRVASASNDHGLGDTVLATVVPDLVTGLKTIFYRHLAVHEDKPVTVRLVGIAVFYSIDSLLPVLSRVYSILDVFVAFYLLQDDRKAYDVEWFVVDNQNAASLVDLLQLVTSYDTLHLTSEVLDLT